MITISIDIDWAPDLVVASVLRETIGRGTPITVFATNPEEDGSGASSADGWQISGTDIEIGWHPQFRDTETVGDVTAPMNKAYPDVNGWKAHNGVTGWPMQKSCIDHGLKYEVLPWSMPTYVAPYAPYADQDFVILHNNFMDAEALKTAEFDWEIDSIPFLSQSNGDNLFILTFHPTILYYDMATQSEYLAAKEYYHAPKPDLSFENRIALKGAMKLFKNIISQIEPEHFTTPSRFLAEQATRARSAKII